MTRIRIWTTLIVLAAGTGMAGAYMNTPPPAAPERIKAESIRPEAAHTAFSTPSPAIAEKSVTARLPATTPEKRIEPAPPPTVALPSEPLFRSATESAPVGTDRPQYRSPVRTNPALANRAFEAPSIVRPAAMPQPAPLASAEDVLAPEVRAAPVARPVRPRPKARTHKSRKVESLFLNPLGVR